ncbi:MAG: TatD family hydrolase, partial [Armatimonadetes bacterium]|nr:TatD family hydrolase [Armatimonadota bacterium]
MPTRFVDTHCHLNAPEFTDDWPEVLARAVDLGMAAAIVVAYDQLSAERALALAAEHPERLCASVGIHPDAVAEWQASENWVRGIARSGAVVAVGEVGLDRARGQLLDSQLPVFEAQLAIAEACQLPLIVHCRDAWVELLEVIERWEGRVSGVLHCFTGSVDDARRATNAGWYLGFGGIVTYPKAENVRAAAAAAPAAHILLETDAPWLAPVPNRGKRNEPAYIPAVAAALAELRNEPLEQLYHSTTANAAACFPAAARIMS